MVRVLIYPVSHSEPVCHCGPKISRRWKMAITTCCLHGWWLVTPAQTNKFRLLAEVWVQITTEVARSKPLSESYELWTIHENDTVHGCGTWFCAMSSIIAGQRGLLFFQRVRWDFTCVCIVMYAQTRDLFMSHPRRLGTGQLIPLPKGIAAEWLPGVGFEPLPQCKHWTTSLTHYP